MKRKALAVVALIALATTGHTRPLVKWHSNRMITGEWTTVGGTYTFRKGRIAGADGRLWGTYKFLDAQKIEVTWQAPRVNRSIYYVRFTKGRVKEDGPRQGERYKRMKWYASPEMVKGKQVYDWVRFEE